MTAGSMLLGREMGALPVGSAAVLIRDDRGQEVTAPPSALVRMRDGSWRASDANDTAPLVGGAMFRVLYRGRDTEAPRCRCSNGDHR